MRERIDWDTRVILLKLIGKYDIYKKELADERDRILSLSPQNYDNLDMPRGTDTTDPTALAAWRLERLETSYKSKVIDAIDRAKQNALPDGVAEPVMLSCKNGRRYNYEHFKNLPYSRSQFYKYKNRFLDEVRYYLGL